jgi:hypothetical protein
MNYSPSTRSRVADIVRGLQVKTSVFINHSYFHQQQAEFFNVFGRIMLMQLFVEFITATGTGGTFLQFNYTSTTPTIGVQPISGASGSIASLFRGGRVVWQGGAVATVAVVTVSSVTLSGISDFISVKPQIIGLVGGIGTIGILTSNDDPQDSAVPTSQVFLNYVPMSPGAYVTKVV